MAKQASTSSSILNLLLNVVIPSFVLMKLSGVLGSVNALIVALLFPFLYGAYDFFQNKQNNILSIIGFSSIFLTGAIGLLQLKPEYIAIKEALIPLIIASVVFATQNSNYPVVIKLFEHVLDIEKIKRHLDTPEKEKKYKSALNVSSYLVGLSFLVSATLNFFLAKVVVVSQPGTEAFNEELGRMTALSYPVIAIPSTIVLVSAIWVLINKLKKITGLSMENLLAAAHKGESNGRNKPR